MKITEIISELDGAVYIQIDNGDNSFTVMSKERFDELEAAKENGTIS